MKSRITLVSLALVLSSALAASAGVKSLEPSKDNTIFESTNSSSQNSNGLGDIFVGRINQASSSIRRGLVQFDIAASIPSGATITDVLLEMRDVQISNGDQEISLHRMLENWGEGTSLSTGGMGAAATAGDATWLYAFYATALADRVAWSTPGGAYEANASASTAVVDDFNAAHVFSWSSAGLVADVQHWLDNPGKNFGWAIRGNESAQQTVKRFNSGEATTAAFRPVLHVTYIPEPTTAVLLGIAGASLLFLLPREARAA